jgi:hypothetical protein
MTTIKATFTNGESIITKINATNSEAKAYYLDNFFNLGSVTDNMQKCIKCEIL